ncbi:uncharacterized protein LOC128344393 isoform X3 [Hemicordylus capensis]|uniref:uncharacterized protein LOC128344393 isoform X3 n=1 Tax=Hemicordylus capensis TaxID=884348 RepID=UPI0023022F28|nr:uncharacterized protein LOC128344393 isoform X3 [Hemicordylus capensis]
MAAAGTEEEETAAPRRPGLACPGLLLRPPPPFTAPRTQPGRRLISRATAAAPNGEAGGGGPAVPRRLPIGRAAWPIAERVPSGGRRGSSPPAPSGLAAALDLANPRMAEAESESIASAQWRLRQAGGEGIVVPTTSKDPKSGTLQGSRGSTTICRKELDFHGSLVASKNCPVRRVHLRLLALNSQINNSKRTSCPREAEDLSQIEMVLKRAPSLS